MPGIFCIFLALACACPGLWAAGQSVIFIHPDGAGVAAWQAARVFHVGPDGDLHWDRLPATAIYRGQMADNLTATSNGGATAHAYGVRHPASSFGGDPQTGDPLESASGFRGSLMMEAMERGIRCGLVNSGSIVEPGTAVFASAAVARDRCEEIAKDVVQSGADVIMSGGEEWLLPAGTAGRHVASGKRTDGLDLIAWARQHGYAVVFDREELEALPAGTRRALGVFAAAHTFHDRTEEDLAKQGLPLYVPSAPTVGEMTAMALEILGGGQFFLVVEEEGTDNFGNANNAPGLLEALRRADETFGVASAFIEKHPGTFLITAADSEAGNPDVIGLNPLGKYTPEFLTGRRDPNGAPFDIAPDGKPFLSAPDNAGNRHPFIISWGCLGDSSGGILVRAAGAGSDAVRGAVPNTAIYTLMREALFGPDRKN